MRRILNKTVPVLITCDIDPTPEASLADKQKAFDEAIDLFDRLNVKATFFTVGNLAADYESALKKCVSSGHETACHGLTHSEEEEYSTLSVAQIRENLVMATRLLEKSSGARITSFRGPRVKTSHRVHDVLEELGYTADSSVCSQRLDFISSNLINFKWLFAPRNAYHPNHKNAFKKGGRPVWVVPVSAIGLPFVSGLLYMFGIRFMKIFFMLLYKESLRTGKPIVYLLHPSEFAPMTIKVRHPSTFKDILARGFYFRRRLKLSHTPEKRLDLTGQFLQEIKNMPYVKFMTMREFIKETENVR